MKKNRISNIKREQKRSFYTRLFASFLQQISIDEPALNGFFVTRVELSNDVGVCYIYFSTYLSDQGQNETDAKRIENALEILKLYKPSMRAMLGQQLQGRYVPDLVFLYDKTKEKVRSIDRLLNEIAQEKQYDQRECKEYDEEKK